MGFASIGRLLLVISVPVQHLATVFALLGVAPQDEPKYSAASFRCSDGTGGLLPLTVVNDEFCDCPDGSDEPGTGACAGQDQTLFHCANEGSIAKRIYASRVGDGVCDCCDGSDEASLKGRGGAVACNNVCAEEGQRARQDFERRVDIIKKGVEKQHEIRSQAVVERANWRWELSRLRKDLPALETRLEEVKKRVAALREAELKESQTHGNASNASATSGVASYRLKDPEGDEGTFHGSVDDRGRAHGSGRVTYDEGSIFVGSFAHGAMDEGAVYKSQLVVSTMRSGRWTDSVESEIANKFPAKATPDASTESPASVATDAGSEGSKPQVSEYAKWMDGAESSLSDKKTDSDEAQVSEYAKWMDGAENTLSKAEPPSEDDEDEDSRQLKEDILQEDGQEDYEDSYDEEDDEEDAVLQGSKFQVKKAGQTTEPDSSQTKEEQDAQKAVTTNKARTKELEKSLKDLEEEHLSYASLAGKTISRKISEFKYKLTFFKSATQDHTSLGNWKGFTGPKTASFEGGSACWQGPPRSLSVTFECGLEEELQDVIEPSRCVYAATVRHPAACDPTEVEALKVDTLVVGPHDEL